MPPKKTPKEMSATKAYDRILEHLTTLKIPLTSEELSDLVSQAERDKMSLLAFLDAFLAVPAATRIERSVERRLKSAKFRDPGTLETFDWNFNRRIKRAAIEELATGDFVRRGDNVVFAGASGLGKSHLIQAIGRRCCVHGYRVRYFTSADLLEQLTAASGDKTLPSEIRKFSRYDLLIIDELGFDKLERIEYPEAPSLLYKVIDGRTSRATALVTNIDFNDWGEYFNDPPLAMALLDRVVDGAIIHKFHGKSYRAHRAATRKQDEAS